MSCALAAASYQRYPIKDLMDACRDYVEKPTGDHIRMGADPGGNDTPEQARKLAGLLQVFRQPSGALCHVNVIPLNPPDAMQAKRNPPSARLRRHSRTGRNSLYDPVETGIDIQAGCGQLAIEGRLQRQNNCVMANCWWCLRLTLRVFFTCFTISFLDLR